MRSTSRRAQVRTRHRQVGATTCLRLLQIAGDESAGLPDQRLNMSVGHRRLLLLLINHGVPGRPQRVIGTTPNVAASRRARRRTSIEIADFHSRLRTGSGLAGRQGFRCALAPDHPGEQAGSPGRLKILSNARARRRVQARASLGRGFLHLVPADTGCCGRSAIAVHVVERQADAPADERKDRSDGKSASVKTLNDTFIAIRDVITSPNTITWATKPFWYSFSV